MAHHRTVFADCGMACRRVLMGVGGGVGGVGGAGGGGGVMVGGRGEGVGRGGGTW